MGVWTGVLGGSVTAVIALALDLLTGEGLDTATGLGAALGATGLAAPAVALLVLMPLLAVAIGVLLALVPPRAAGLATGLAGGAALGLVAALVVGRGAFGPYGLPLVVAGLCAGLLTGFLYSRYARIRVRPASSRPFAR